MSIHFLGDFLLERGAINTEQLNAAVDFQIKQNLSLGQLAQKESLLDQKQIEVIFEKQKIEDKKFGEIAVELKLLSQEMLQKLLKKQKENNIIFGEALLELKLIDKEKLAKEIDDFNLSQKNALHHIYTEVAFCDYKNRIKDSIAIFERFYYREFHRYIKFEEIRFTQHPEQHCIYLQKELLGDTYVSYILSYDKESVHNTPMEDFIEFFNDFIRRIYNYFLESDIIVIDNGEYTLIQDPNFDLNCYFGINFITTEGRVILYIKI